ncbi:MAG: methionine adenosyltransferase, partial [Spirochaetales bacterium]|nr:methionine adenosyltransferase [Spirochaetales bacterium]
MGTNDAVGGAGDQGMMFGYACDETPDLMPLPITLANQMAYKLSQKRKDGTIPFILPDGKTQVTVEYGEDGWPSRIDTIVISTQHKESVTPAELAVPLQKLVIQPVLEDAKKHNPKLDIDSYDLYINPTGRFVKGGPAADSGLTGRKIIVDTYGGYAAHGGGAFSGKDPTKVDRSAAYMARYIAKNIVASGLAGKCQVQLAYAIGVAEPVSVRVDTFGTLCKAEPEQFRDEDLAEMVAKLFPLTPGGIIKRLNLRAPIYKATSAYGHFGMVTGDNRTWEQTDMAGIIRGYFLQNREK